MITLGAIQELTNQTFGYLEGVLSILSMYPLTISTTISAIPFTLPFAILQGFSYT